MPLTAVHERSVACQLGQDPVQVSTAREQARAALPGWGLGGHVGLAELIVSELATNALRYGDGPIGYGCPIPTVICVSRSMTVALAGRSGSTQLPTTNVAAAWSCWMA